MFLIKMGFSVLILICLGSITVRGQVIHRFGDGNLSWENANSACTLATPRINYTDGEMIVGFEGGAVSMMEGEEAWLGYVLDSVILQYIGCMKFDEEKDPRFSTYIDTGADPGFCFSACRERGYIGIMKTKCFCFNTLPTLPLGDMFETGCSQSCARLNDEASCGGNNVVSLYKRADGLTVSDVEDFPSLRNTGNCVLYDKNVDKFYATKCTTSYRIGCQTMTDEMVDINSRTVTWLEMTGYCSSRQVYPYTYKGVMADSGDYYQVWTGMIKARKLYKPDQDIRQAQAFTYVRAENGRCKVRFANPEATDVKRFICQEAGEVTTTEETTLVTGTKETPEVNTKASTSVERANLLPLFIVIPIVVIAVAIVLILLYIRRRRKIRNKALKSGRLVKSPYGKEGKKRKGSLTEGSHLCKDAVKMNDIVDSDVPVPDKKPRKRNSGHSNNLVATISLDNVIVDNDAFVNDSDDASDRQKSTTSFKDEIGKQSVDKNKEKTTRDRKPSNKDVTANKPGPVIKDYDAKTDHEYARINKKRKDSKPQKHEDGQTYDNLGKGKKENKNVKLGRDYDEATFDNKDMYDSTSKPMAVPQRDYLYDGLSKF